MNKRVLITGGTGSFGQAMTKYLLKTDTDITVCILSRDEHKQERMQRDLKEHGYDIDRVRFFIGDVRDKSRLRKAVRGVTHVIHAAALKIIPSCEYNVSECIQTNIMGTENVVEVCAFSDTVKSFLLISTDKAVLPINTYGRSKALAENIVTSASFNYGGTDCVFSAIRLGNVVGSNGSVIPLFAEKLKKGEKMPVTDTEMTRFFIPMNQVVRFAADALNNGCDSEIWIPKMKAAKIIELAYKFGGIGNVQIVGIRPGEKIHEDIISQYELERVGGFDDKWIIYYQSIQSKRQFPVRSCDVKRWDLNELIKEDANGTC